MKTLQNDFTTPEQSKWLLELGVPKDSADCVHTYLGIKMLPENIVYSQYDWMVADGDHRTPCWSVGRLMEICDICILAGGGKKGEFYFDRNNLNKTYVQEMVDTIEGMLKLKLLDFSKLEE